MGLIKEKVQMNDDLLKLLEAANALIIYIDKEYVFDKAAAGGCSGMDYHQSDTFYDLIVNTRKAISQAENGLEGPSADSDNKIQKEGCAQLFEATKSLLIHIEKEHAFDKVNDMGPVGVETYQSNAFIEIIQSTNKALKEAEGRLNVSE
jgi:hypothetical protein